jgi:hypothetical protein
MRSGRIADEEDAEFSTPAASPPWGAEPAREAPGEEAAGGATEKGTGGMREAAEKEIAGETGETGEAGEAGRMDDRA